MTDKTRECKAFEEFVSSELGDVAVTDEGRYISPKIQNNWLTWQAATARALAEAVRVCEEEYLTDNLGNSDAEYDRGVRDCITAIKEALK